MSFLDKIFKKPLQPSVTKKLVRENPGPLTVFEAWVYAKEEALSLNSEAKLILITSGTDIRSDGKSFIWEFLFSLNSRQARVLLTYGPSDDAVDIESASIMLVKRVSKATDRSVLALPFDFRNSPEVVEELSRSGVDFVAGPTDMKLEAKVSAEGKPVWVTFFWGEERTVPFSASVG